MDVAKTVAELGLAELPHKGGLYRKTYSDEHLTAVYYLLTPGALLPLHQLAVTAIYHYYAGDPLELLLLHADGSVTKPVVGPDVVAGQRPQLVVPPGIWQGAFSRGTTFLGATMAPEFSWQGLHLGDQAALLAAYPVAAEQVMALSWGR